MAFSDRVGVVARS